MARPRLSIGTMLLLLNLAALVLPVSGIWLLRVYESALIRQTESELLAQGAIVAAVYRAAWHDAGGRAEAGSPIDPRWTRQPGFDQPWLPRFAALDLAADPILPPPPDPEPAQTPAEAVAATAGAPLGAMLRDAQRTTLAGIRVLDRQGVVVASTGETLGQSLRLLPEVERALQGEPVSVVRQRAKGPAPSAIAFSRGSAIRVFTALPVLDNERVIGVVLLSRTPHSLAEALYGKRWHLAILAGLLLASVGGLSAAGTLAIVRPLRAVTAQAKRAAEGEQGAMAPLTRPVVREVAELSETLSRMAATLEQRADYIRDFAAHVSHEFKTPLTAIRGTVELLREHFASMEAEDRERFLANLDADAGRLERLVRRLLDLARADVMRGGEDEVCQAAELIATIAARYRQQGLAITVTAEPVALAIGAEALETVLTNLIENARQHGGPQVTLSLDAEGILRLADDGPGISEANAQRVFAPFFTTARKQGGTGLGLSIVGSLLRHCGGSIKLLPTARGAVFELRLPLGSARILIE